MRSQWFSGAAGQSCSIAPDMKSETMASTATPAPSMKMPVCPVARKSESTPRASSPRCRQSVVYILPTEQSVPTVRSRRPLRGSPVPIGNDPSGCRTSCRVRPPRRAASATAGMSPSRPWRPLATSMPASIAATMVSIQSWENTPPRLTTPTSRVRAPRSRPSATESSGRSTEGTQPGRRSCPTHSSGRHCQTPMAVLAESSSHASPRKRRYGRLMAMICTI